jgi:hypothetical protein
MCPPEAPGSTYVTEEQEILLSDASTVPNTFYYEKSILVGDLARAVCCWPMGAAAPDFRLGTGQ